MKAILLFVFCGLLVSPTLTAGEGSGGTMMVIEELDEDSFLTAEVGRPGVVSTELESKRVDADSIEKVEEPLLEKIIVNENTFRRLRVRASVSGKVEHAGLLFVIRQDRLINFEARSELAVE